MLKGTVARKKGFKKGVDQDDSRRRRTETTIQIRKEKKDDQIQKRRGVSWLALHRNLAMFFLKFAVHGIAVFTIMKSI